MPIIPITITEKGAELFDKVVGGINRITNAEQRAAEAAKVRVKAQTQGGSWGGNGQRTWRTGGGSHSERGGGGSEHGEHAGFFGALHRAGRGVGGEFGEVAHRGSALMGLAGMGAAGLAIAGVGVALNALTASFEHAAERVKSVAERVESYESKKWEARASLGESGRATARSEGAGLRRLDNNGQLDAYKAVRASGLDISAESFAKLNGSDDRLEAVREGANLGTDPNAMADLAAKTPMKTGRGRKVGLELASRIQGRRISQAEADKAFQNNYYGNGIAGKLNDVAGVEGQISNLGIRNIDQAGGAARLDLSQQTDPVAAATSQLQKTVEKKAEILNRMGDQATSIFAAFGQALKKAGYELGMGDGDYHGQADRLLLDNAAGQHQTE